MGTAKRKMSVMGSRQREAKIKVGEVWENVINGEEMEERERSSLCFLHLVFRLAATPCLSRTRLFIVSGYTPCLKKLCKYIFVYNCDKC